MRRASLRINDSETPSNHNWDEIKNAMKTYAVLCLSAAIELPAIALAKLPRNPAFGQLEGTIDYWTQADASLAAKYHEAKKRVVDDAQEKEVAEARKSKNTKRRITQWAELLQKSPASKSSRLAAVCLTRRSRRSLFRARQLSQDRYTWWAILMMFLPSVAGGDIRLPSTNSAPTRIN
jgi:hypothetical protein